MKRALFSSLLVAALLSTVTADAEPSLQWKEEWPRFRTAQYVALPVMVAGFATLYAVPRFSARWGGGLLFDDAVRRGLKTEDPDTKTTVANLSTVAYWTMQGYPLLIDGLLVPLVRKSPDVAWQLTLINAQALAFSGLVFRTTEATVRRARPYVSDCLDSGKSAEDCKESGIGGTNSFVSGHMALASTGAALTCVHHAHLKLYGGGVPDALACVVGVLFAVGNGIGRIVSDNHYATDVIAGSVLGGLSGWLIPSLLHYGFDGRGVGSARKTTAFMPQASPHSFGLSMIGFL